MVLDSGNIGIQSSTNICNVKRSGIRYGHMAISSVLLDWRKRSNWQNPGLQKIIKLLGIEQAEKDKDHGV